MGDERVCLYAFYSAAVGSSVVIYMYIFRWLLRAFVVVVVVVAVERRRKEEGQEEGG